jgi:XTP/dITP diphosphohydrolase
VGAEKPVIYVVSENPGKLREIRFVLGKFGFEVEPLRARKLEIQSDDLEEVARVAAESLLGRAPEPFVVEDSGLFIASLRGFPGPYSSYVYRTIGCEGVLKLMRGVEDRRAKFVCAAALGFNGSVSVFRGEVEGAISEEPRGRGGFGFDPIFVPLGHAKTFAEMTLEEKCAVSHRSKALETLAVHLLERLNLHR